MGYAIESCKGKGEIRIIMKEKDHQSDKPHICEVAIADKENSDSMMKGKLHEISFSANEDMNEKSCWMFA